MKIIHGVVFFVIVGFIKQWMGVLANGIGSMRFKRPDEQLWITNTTSFYPSFAVDTDQKNAIPLLPIIMVFYFWYMYDM